MEHFEEIVSNLGSAVDKTGARLALKAITISVDGATRQHRFTPSDELTDLRSISKVALCLAVGEGIRRGVRVFGKPLSLDTRIFPVLEPYVAGLESSSKDRLHRVTVAHLLSNTMGHKEGFLFRKDIGTRDMGALLPYIAEKPIEYDPGAHFSYSNVGPFLMSVLVQQELGVSLSAWANSILFEPIGISNFQWKNYGAYTAGCSGLCLGASDLHKIGQLLLADGDWNGISIVPADWIKAMRTAYCLSPDKYEPHRALPKYAYGFGLWITKSGNYYCDGTDGQYLIVIPDKACVISTLGAQADMKPITECFRVLIDQ